MKNKMNNINYRPIILIANSSWYLFHYRNLLLRKLKDEKNYLVTLSPIDKNTLELSKISLHIPWRVFRSGNKNLIMFFLSLLRLILIFRIFKPRIVHSHTLKTNFLTTIASFIFGIPCIISFAGLGQISRTKGLKKTIFIFIIKTIGFLSYRKIGRNFLEKSPKRTSFIFQNKNDMKFIKNIIKISSNKNFLINGSGVPDYYFVKSKNNRWEKSIKLSKNKLAINFHLIYLGRLLKSKGILRFIEISKNFKNLKSSVYGGIDKSSRDSLNKDEINQIKKNNENIRFHGVKENPLLIQKNNFPILVIPSVYGEGLPRGIAEALTLGIPVICSKEASCDYFDESLVYIAKDNFLNSYINCIDQIIDDYLEDNLKQKIKKGRLFAKQNLSEHQIVMKTLMTYEHIEKVNRNLTNTNFKNKNSNNWITN